MSENTQERIYEGILDLIDEKSDISSIKVAEIAKRAGIGKGTVYEYCDSKEQLIVDAIIYMADKETKLIANSIKPEQTFKESYFILMKDIREIIKRNITLFKYLALKDCDYFFIKAIQMESENKFEGIRRNYINLFKKIVDKGLQEKIIEKKPADSDFIIAANNSMMCLYLYQKGIEELQDKDEKEIIEKSYNIFVKLLN